VHALALAKGSTLAAARAKMERLDMLEAQVVVARVRTSVSACLDFHFKDGHWAPFILG